VAVQTQILSTLGVSTDESDQLAEDHHSSVIPEAEKALLDCARSLSSSSSNADSRFSVERLHSHGFTESQILEVVVISAFANLLNTVQFGLGITPDFPPRRVFTLKDLHPLPCPPRRISDAISIDDPDGELVTQVQGGDTDAFEELVRRHTRRIFGTLAGIVGNMEGSILEGLRTHRQVRAEVEVFDLVNQHRCERWDRSPSTAQAFRTAGCRG
jgi:hypothetical protein